MPFRAPISFSPDGSNHRGSADAGKASKIARIGMCFSRPFEGSDPLSHIGKKLPVYIRLLKLCQQKGWQVFVLTRRTYQGKGIFNGAWHFDKNKFSRWEKPVKIDLVYDRVAGMKFPPEVDSGVAVVNRRDFKFLCYNKWLAYQKIGQFMPKTFWVGGKEGLTSALSQIKTDWMVLKPHNGMKGIGVYVGPKEKAMSFKFSEKKIYSRYIAQEFVDTSGGIPGIVRGKHDLRVAVANDKAIWSHVRTPPPGSFKANVAQGGSIKELDCSKLPASVKKITFQIAEKFDQEFDNPIYSIDFGMSKNGPLIFELNDQIGFPLWEMRARDTFLQEHIKNFEEKLNS